MRKKFAQFSLQLVVASLLLTISTTTQAGIVADFEDYPLSPESYFNGPDPNGVIVPGSYGPVNVGTITSGGVDFVNRYDMTYGSWSGFSVSNTTDTTTAGYLNQFSAYTGSGATGSSNYGVAFGYRDLDVFDPTSAAQLERLPSLYLPDGYKVSSADFTNTTYAVLSMLEGDSFTKKFGGDDGSDPDYFVLSIYGIDANGQVLSTFIDFYLADYRFADNALDYIVDEWVNVDLSLLEDAVSLHFNVSLSDVGDSGLNTPAYFAIDNLALELRDSVPVPEPSTLALLTTGLLAGAATRRRRQA